MDFSNKDRFTDELDRLLTHFETVRRALVMLIAYLGNSYEYLIAKFADDTGKESFIHPKRLSGCWLKFYSQKKAIHCMIPLVDLEGCFGSGQFPETQQQGWSKVSLYGQEKNINTFICKMALFTGHRQGIY